MAHAAYAARFPDMTGLFELGDFRLFAIEPQAVRVVLGFAQAASLEPATVAAALASR
jgi:putative heme iron utilization protein